MSEELRPCPFCGKIPPTGNDPGYKAYPNESCECYLNIIEDGCFFGDVWNTRPIEDALRAKLDMAVEAMRALLYAAEMRRNWDILSSDDFDEAYPDECSWAFGDVDENMIQKMEMAQKALEEKKRLK